MTKPSIFTRMSFRLSQKLRREFEARCLSEGVEKSEKMRQLIEAYLYEKQTHKVLERIDDATLYDLSLLLAVHSYQFETAPSEIRKDLKSHADKIYWRWRGGGGFL